MRRVVAVFLHEYGRFLLRYAFLKRFEEAFVFLFAAEENVQAFFVDQAASIALFRQSEIGVVLRRVYNTRNEGEAFC